MRRRSSAQPYHSPLLLYPFFLHSRRNEASHASHRRGPTSFCEVKSSQTCHFFRVLVIPFPLPGQLSTPARLHDSPRTTSRLFAMNTTADDACKMS